VSDASFIKNVQRSADFIGVLAPVFIVEQVPELPFDGKREVTLNRLYPNRSHMDLSRSHFSGSVRMQNYRLDHVSFTSVDDGLFDKNGHLVLEVSGEPTYSDNHHLTATGAELTAPAFSRIFEELTPAHGNHISSKMKSLELKDSQPNLPR
jgi:SGNH domain (fused to AT3 domains)